ncbi:MAG: tRNA uridine-5-carboxymethylaminomethyl(34) synthesis GTPase MnmE [Desulfuromonadales bacterium]|nr:tRNA uridine-5-carboxymethylaminomethyl(34) synthesis GTPase MnmE [Desulfuromonadales bacterium]NIR34405.1 tRNA uridine-5-carboxymethylaminomethyl(34) synthesis GTPase MnmE [Desulfuromonadales bacterium]NIS40438.1 tRNA uridine-5-carboxymethylaminomethyl(34) synthesis GTPase MnmE [Desulfuromonadales bacterium]
MHTDDTIVAPVTPAGEGGVSILRLSGADSLPILHKFFKPACGTRDLADRQLYYGHLLRPDGDVLDEIMAVFMQAPRTYTCEQVVEIHCHGSPGIVRDILDLCIDAGARVARPGEFTLRAFLNGRLDLSQAEAVIDLIKSRTASSQRIAFSQLEGRLSRFIYKLRDQLCDQLALVETYIDFPDEDIDQPHILKLRQTASDIAARITRLLEGFDSGRVLREGASILIIGRPNVGKSSLMNRLLGEQRAIVTDIAGTTRDTIEEQLTIGNIPVRLIDSAGIRETADPIEAQGVDRARVMSESADLVLLVIDGSCGITADDRLALSFVDTSRVILVVNKIDLGSLPLEAPFDHFRQSAVCARTGDGMAALQEEVEAELLGHPHAAAGEDILLSDRRHRDALVRSRQFLDRFLDGLDRQVSAEFLALELREALAGLGEITGETTPDEVLDRVFERFCIGK